MSVTFFGILFLFAGLSLARDEAQDYYWREYVPGDIPPDAIEGAPGMYIGQVYYNGHTVPAAIYPHSYLALGSFGGKIAIKENIKILCGPDKNKFYWEYMNFKDTYGDEMKNAIKGGFQTGIGNFYIGKLLYDNEWKVGRTFPIESASKGCYVFDKNSKEIKLTEFYMLKYCS